MYAGFKVTSGIWVSVKGEETIKKTMAENEKIERGMKYGAGT